MSISLQNPYCTVEQVRSYIRNSDAAIQDQLAQAVNAASRFVDRYKGRDYFEHDFGDSNPLIIDRFSGALVIERPVGTYFDHGLFPRGTRRFLQLEWRILELTSVTVGGIAFTEGVDYKVRSEEGVLIRLLGDWPSKLLDADAIQIKGRFGYDQGGHSALDPTLVPAGMPDQISQGTVQVAAALSRQNFKDVVGLDGMKTSLLDITIPKSAFMLLGSQALLT